MVSITHDWEGFEGYASNCRVGTYQVKDVVDGKEVRVKAGKLGFVAVYDIVDQDEAAFLQRILKFCKLNGFIEVEGSISDELFHT